jgi:VanZ family protein
MTQASRQRTAGLLAAAAYVSVVCWLTLRPYPWVSDTGVTATNAASDFFRNTLLLFPFGVALALAGVSTRRVALAALTLAVGIESIQGFIPGRFSTISDAFANALGAGVGAWLWHRRSALRHPPPAASLAGGAAPMIACLAMAFFVHPVFPTDRTWRADWTPDLATRYRGRVSAAHLGTYFLKPGAVVVPADVIPTLAGPVDLSATVVVGRTPTRRAVVIRLYDDARRDLMDLSFENQDVIFRIRSRAAALLFDPPALRWRDILAGLRAGDTLRLEIQRRGRRTCLIAQGQERCAAWRVRDGWMLLASERSISPRTATVVGWTFIAALAIPVGLLAGSLVSGTVGFLSLVVAMVALPRVLMLAPLTAADWVAVACGTVAGIVLRRILLQAGG